MIEGLQPYSEYKDSAVPWLGSIPSSWRVERTKRVFRKRKELNVGRKCTNVLSLTLRGVVNNDPDSPEGLVPKDYSTYQLFQKNDLVFKLIDLENLRTSRVGLVHEDGIMSSAYLRLIPKADCNVRFFYHQFFDLYTRAVFNALGAGVRSTLGAEDLGEIRILLPPPDEQAAIVRFMEHANRKIDGFIRAKRKLIGLLNEQKQAIIHRAVTRGLDPHAPLKSSGIPWLGDIPHHWEVRRLSSVAKFISTKAHEQFVDATGTHIYVSARFVSTGGTARKLCTRNLSPATKDDVLMVMSDLPNGRALARAFLVEDDASYAVNQRVCIIRPRKMIPAFLAHQANRSWGLLQNDDHYNQTHLSNRDFKTLPLLCPPISEQEEIVRAIDAKTKHIPALIARTEREIALMQEYRTRLTADVVTGKLDVRPAAARLPALTPDSIPEQTTVDLDDSEDEEAEV